MPQTQGIDLIRRAVDAWNRHEIEDLLVLCDPEIEFVNSPTAVEPGTRRGFDEATAAIRAQWEILLDGRHEIDRTFDRGDEVVTLGRVSRRMPGSEARLEQPILVSWAIPDGRVTRIAILGFGAGEVQEALTAAGLEG
jgi:ketosteroid isomerase-like protein